MNGLNALDNRDYTLIIDKSGSMMGDDGKGRTRWEAVQESSLAIANKCASFDPDGITLYAFNGRFKRHDNVTPAHVEAVFREHEPMGTTALHSVLHDAFDNWRARKKKNDIKTGETIVVITDGQPDDQIAAAKEIVNVTKYMDKKDELAVAFFQIGNDPGAQKYLKRLDNDLERQGAKFDIVSTKTFDELEETTLTQALLEAIQQ